MGGWVGLGWAGTQPSPSDRPPPLNSPIFSTQICAGDCSEPWRASDASSFSSVCFCVERKRERGAWVFLTSSGQFIFFSLPSTSHRLIVPLFKLCFCPRCCCCFPPPDPLLLLPSPAHPPLPPPPPTTTTSLAKNNRATIKREREGGGGEEKEDEILYLFFVSPTGLSFLTRMKKKTCLYIGI